MKPDLKFNNYKTLNFVFIGLTYFLLAKFGLFLATINSSASPVWPATGLAIATLYVFGKKYWPAIFFGALAANYFTSSPVLTSFPIALGNCIEAVFGAYLLRKIFKTYDEQSLNSQNEMIGVVCVSLLAPIMSATVGTSSLFFANAITFNQLSSTWTTWWVGDLLGALMLIPITLRVLIFKASKFKLSRSFFRGSFSFLVLSIVGFSIFYFYQKPELIVLLFPALLLMLMAGNGSWVVLLSTVFSVLAVTATVKGLGPFVSGTLNDNLLHLNLLLTTLLTSGLALAGFKKSGPLTAPSIALIIGWSLTAGIFYTFHIKEREKSDIHFDSIILEIEQHILEKFATYEDALRGGASLYAASHKVELDEWRRYVTSLRLVERHPGIHGLGVVWPVKDAELSKYQTAVSKDFGEKFLIHPVELDSPIKNSIEHYVITFLEPRELNRKAIGLDLASEQARKVAADLARDSGEPAITSTITLVQDAKRRPGFLFFIPMYKHPEVEHLSVKERRTQFFAWVYAPFIAEEFFNSVTNKYNDEIQLTIFQSNGNGNAKNSKTFLYSSHDDVTETNFNKKTKIFYGGQSFDLGWKKMSGFASVHDAATAWSAAVGAILSLLLASLVATLQLINLKAQVIADEKTMLLSKSEKDLQNLIQLAPAGIFRTDANGACDYVSERWMQYSGIDLEEAKGDGWIKALHPEDRESVFKEWDQSINEDRAFSLEYRFQKPNGVITWIAGRAEAIKDLSGNVIGYLGAVQDISASKLAREELKGLESRFQSVVQSAHDAIVGSDDQGNILFWNKSAERLFGYSEEEAKGKSLNILMPERFREAHSRGMNRVVQSGQSKLAGQTVILQGLRKDGSEFPIELSLANWQSNGKMFFSSIIRDITERVQTEEKIKNLAKDLENKVEIRTKELSEAQKRLKLVIDGIPALVSYIDRDLRYQFVNKSYERWFGKKDNDLIGKTMEEVLGFEAAKVTQPYVEKAFSGETVEYERVIPYRDGGTRIVSTTYVPNKDSGGNVLGIVVFVNDISERVLAAEEKTQLIAREQAAVEASKMKSSFLASMSHEIRTPINGVIGMTGVLLDSNLTPEQRDWAETVKRSADSLLVIINDILDFSKVEAGKLDIENIQFDLSETLDDIRKTLSFTARKKGLIFGFEGEANFPHKFHGDPGRIRQILVNLISNAMKFTEKGKVILRIKEMAQGNTSKLTFEVEDSGIGISEKNFKELFQPFNQLDASTSRKFGGTGLGLSISKSLVELMNGEIGARSKLGEGSTFWFSIPLKKGDDIVTGANNHKVEIIPKKAKKALKILIAEDNQVNQIVALKFLEKLGYRADAVANGLEVISALKDLNYDLILMDCQMPEMDGYEATRELRKKGIKIPIIAMTANALQGERERCLDAGMDDYVTKPVEINALASAIESCSG